MLFAPGNLFFSSLSHKSITGVCVLANGTSPKKKKENETFFPPFRHRSSVVRALLSPHQLRAGNLRLGSASAKTQLTANSRSQVPTAHRHTTPIHESRVAGRRGQYGGHGAYRPGEERLQRRARRLRERCAPRV